MTDSKGSFWEKWVKADYLERIKLVRALTVFSNSESTSDILPAITPTLLNSYLEDLYDYLQEKSD